MIKYLYNLKFIFHIYNFLLLLLYLFPGSILGYLFYKNLTLQPQLTSDFIVSANHVYVFLILSILGILAFIKQNKINLLYIYLILFSVFGELLHFIIPNRGFQFADLFGNLVGILSAYIFYKTYIFFTKN